MTFVEFLDELDPTHLLWERRRAAIDAQIANRNLRHCHIGQISMKPTIKMTVLDNRLSPPKPITWRDLLGYGVMR